MATSKAYDREPGLVPLTTIVGEPLPSGSGEVRRGMTCG